MLGANLGLLVHGEVSVMHAQMKFQRSLSVAIELFSYVIYKFVASKYV